MYETSIDHTVIVGFEILIGTDTLIKPAWKA